VVTVNAHCLHLSKVFTAQPVRDVLLQHPTEVEEAMDLGGDANPGVVPITPTATASPGGSPTGSPTALAAAAVAVAWGERCLTCLVQRCTDRAPTVRSKALQGLAAVLESARARRCAPTGVRLWCAALRTRR
jgi:hypothetical protein